MSFLQKKYTMNKNSATSTLQNVYDACDQTVQTPIDEVMESTTTTTDYSGYFIAVIVALVLTVLAPLAFIPFSTNINAPNYKAEISIDDYKVEDGILYIDLRGSFIDYSSIYAITASGSKIYPAEHNINTGLITFIYDDTEWNIFVSDLNGKPVHMLLTPPN